MATFTRKFESAKQEWATPPEFFERLHKEFKFTMDLAADSSNHKTPRYFSKADDALSKKWIGACWLNPPYGDKRGNRLSDWVKKAHHESKNGATIVMLIPARTNTRWFHLYCMNATELRFIEGRPKFGGATHGLPQPLVVVVFSPRKSTLRVSGFRAHQ